eukprot:3936876-Rhodomonas_salina.3
MRCVQVRLGAHSTVVLSACNTGLGAVKAEGVVGLARALLAAGAGAAGRLPRWLAVSLSRSLSHIMSACRGLPGLRVCLCLSVSVSVCVCVCVSKCACARERVRTGTEVAHGGVPVVSLWSVDDEATLKLMCNFYAKLRAPGREGGGAGGPGRCSVARALQQAMLEMMARRSARAASHRTRRQRARASERAEERREERRDRDREREREREREQ